MRIRELPPLRLHVDAVTPSGRHYRWGDDEPDPANIPAGLKFSDTMPGGFESMDVTLPRKPGVDYADLKRLSTLRVLGAGGEDVVGEYRLERTPRVSGDQMAINPSAVGWQAHLDDDKSASMIYIDRDHNVWVPASRAREIALIAANFTARPPQTMADLSAGTPSLDVGWDEDGGWSATASPICEAWYDAGPGNFVGRIRGTWTKGLHVNQADGNWHWAAGITTNDQAGIASDLTGELRAAGPGTIDLAATTTDKRYGLIQHYYGPAAGGTDVSQRRFSIYWTDLRVFGTHGLTIRGSTAATEGVLASDVVAHAVTRWAPLLRITDESIQPTQFVVPQLAFPDPGPVSQIIRGAIRLELPDWAVWEGRVFWLHDRGARGRRWRARIGPARLEETGPQVDRLWESIIVQYQDVDGTTRTVGPPGSGADTTSADLKDSDPENPANQLGIIRRDLLVMGVGTAGSATEVGRQFLEQTKLLDSSGRAVLTGHVIDDRGVIHPYSHVRSGDYISFIDANDTSYRRIVRADKNTSDRSCAIDLDAPPDGLAALLERLGVVLVPLGL